MIQRLLLGSCKLIQTERGKVRDREDRLRNLPCSPARKGVAWRTGLMFCLNQYVPDMVREVVLLGMAWCGL